MVHNFLNCCIRILHYFPDPRLKAGIRFSFFPKIRGSGTKKVSIRNIIYLQYRWYCSICIVLSFYKYTYKLCIIHIPRFYDTLINVNQVTYDVPYIVQQSVMGKAPSRPVVNTLTLTLHLKVVTNEKGEAVGDVLTIIC